MHNVTRVAVEGFWETHDFKVQLFPEVTFLIGANGTGKTTLINLIAAALTADLRTLDKISFKKLTIDLKSTSGELDAHLIVTKGSRNERSGRINYRIGRGGKTDEEFRVSIMEVGDRLVTRRNPDDGRLYRVYSRAAPPELLDALRELVSVNWISIYRTSILDAGKDDGSFEAVVDQRLSTLSTELLRYFSTLGALKDEQVRIFQESVFLSLLDHYEGEKLVGFNIVREMPEFTPAIESILQELHVPKQVYNEVMEKFKSTSDAVYNRILQSVNAPELQLSTTDAVFLIGLRRISALIQRWKDLQSREETIFAPRDRWLTIVNSLLQRKRMEITASNEMQFVSRTGKVLNARMLSSGEKQLLILLIETLLQREQPSIFISDEPELSLHVLWQEKLVASLRELNPNAQIIAATHSPDIVGALADRTIDMETVIP